MFLTLNGIHNDNNYYLYKIPGFQCSIVIAYMAFTTYCICIFSF